jgi:hypothetical protein
MAARAGTKNHENAFGFGHKVRQAWRQRSFRTDLWSNGRTIRIREQSLFSQEVRQGNAAQTGRGVREKTSPIKKATGWVGKFVGH